MTTERSKKAILDLYRAVARETKNPAVLGEQKEAFKHFLDENRPEVNHSNWVLPGQIRQAPPIPQTDEDAERFAAWAVNRDKALARAAEATKREKIAQLVQAGKYKKAMKKLAKLVAPEDDGTD